MPSKNANYLYRIGVCIGAALLVLCQHATAQVAEPVTGKSQTAVEAKLTQWRVVMDNKKGETFADAKSVLPGDVIEYRSTYSNVSKKTVKSLVVVLPLPEGFEYVTGSSKPAGSVVQAATSDGRYADLPLLRTVKDKDGQSQTERVPNADYRSLRWAIGDLLPGNSFEIKARARVGSTPSESEPQAVLAPSKASGIPTAVSVARQ